MTRLDAAMARFSAALDLLETRLSARVGQPQGAGLDSELFALRRERDRLAARIASLEEESSSLAGLTEAVESRLDGAIAEIRAVLGRG